MYSLAIGKEGQNARLAAKLTGWWIDIRSQGAAERGSEGIGEAPSAFEPYADGEEPDLDLIATLEEPEPAPVAAEPKVPVGTTPSTEEVEEAPPTEAGSEEDVSFAAGLQEVPIPDREEREAEDYGEETKDDEEDEEYEIPDLAAPEDRPTTIRFAEDVLPQREEEEETPRKARRRRRTEEDEDDEEQYDYSGRIR
jgi:N utilization substance protein A